MRRNRRWGLAPFCQLASAALAVLLASTGCSSDDAGGGGSGPDAGADAADTGPDTVADTSPSPLADGVCAPELGEGDLCRNSNSPCASPLRCIDGTCSEDHGVGEPCSSSFDCTDTNYCEDEDLQGNNLASPVCRPQLGQDAPCLDSIPSMCAPIFECIRGTCRAASQDGGPCESSGDCDGSQLYCNEAELAADNLAGVCQPDLLEGDPCHDDYDGCGSGLGCFEGSCITGRLEGETCVNGSDCADDLYCDQYYDHGGTRTVAHCEPEVALGEPCQDAESSNCADGACVAGVCVDDQPLGAACNGSFDCADGLYCNEP